MQIPWHTRGKRERERSSGKVSSEAVFAVSTYIHTLHCISHKKASSKVSSKAAGWWWWWMESKRERERERSRKKGKGIWKERVTEEPTS